MRKIWSYWQPLRIRLCGMPYIGRVFCMLDALCHWLGSSTYRRSVVMRRDQPAGLFQPYANTSENRYPRVFSTVQAVVVDGPDRQILSFGCSSGEEVFSLAAYFPQARITGIDINPQNIALCRKRWLKYGADPRLSFTLSSCASGVEVYDAIFAMAVFRHGALGTRPASCADYINFSAFEACVATLISALKPGGILSIAHSNFRLEDSRYANIFTPIKKIIPNVPRYTPVYGADDMLTNASGETVIYRKALADL